MATTTRELEIAWAAGLFEGEGCMYVNEGKHPHRRHQGSLGTTLGMRDFDVVEAFRDVVGVGATYTRPPQKKNWSEQLIWFASGPDAVVVIGLLSPYFGERRLRKARECLDWFAERYTHHCRGCNTTFLALDPRALYCSERCRGQVSRGTAPTGQLRAFGDPVALLTVGCDRSTRRVRESRRDLGPCIEVLARHLVGAPD